MVLQGKHRVHCAGSPQEAAWQRRLDTGRHRNQRVSREKDGVGEVGGQASKVVGYKDTVCLCCMLLHLGHRCRRQWTNKPRVVLCGASEFTAC